MGHLRAAPAGSPHHPGLSGHKEAGLAEPTRATPCSGEAALWAKELCDTRTRVDKSLCRARGRNGRGRKTKTVSQPLGCLPSPGMHWSKQARVPHKHTTNPLVYTVLAAGRKSAVRPARAPASLTLEMFCWSHKGYSEFAPQMLNLLPPALGPSLLSWRTQDSSSWHLSRAAAFPFCTWVLLCPDTLPIGVCPLHPLLCLL